MNFAPFAKLDKTLHPFKIQQKDNLTIKFYH